MDEIGHAFDAGSQAYDSLGQLGTWWSPPSSLAFAVKARCLDDVYASMEAPADVPAGAALNAARTAREA